jgi:FKBP12-rapamycin complex-associated protein
MCSLGTLQPLISQVGWVHHTDTLHALIRDHRAARKVMLNIEHRLMIQVRCRGIWNCRLQSFFSFYHKFMLQMASTYEHLTVLQVRQGAQNFSQSMLLYSQKVEVFRYALDNTTGQDLYKVISSDSFCSNSD